MPVIVPSVLVIGRSANGLPGWSQLRGCCGPGQVLRASDAYRGMAVLMQYRGLRLVVVNVDDFSQDEMAFFSAVRRFRPGLQLLAVGKGDELSNPRLSEAMWAGAQQAVSATELLEKLPSLLGLKVAAVRPPQIVAPPAAVEPVKPQKPPVEEPSPPAIAEPAKVEAPPESQVAEKALAESTLIVPASLQKGRSQARAKRKAPAKRKAKSASPRQSRDIVTPEELSVLLGDEQAEAKPKRKSSK